MFYGQTHYDELYITVNFIWLLAPIALWTMSTVFLWATIYQTKKHDMPVWKSSPMVKLYYLDREVATTSAKQFGKRLDEVVVRKSGSSWQLEKA